MGSGKDTYMEWFSNIFCNFFNTNSGDKWKIAPKNKTLIKRKPSNFQTLVRYGTVRIGNIANLQV